MTDPNFRDIHIWIMIWIESKRDVQERKTNARLTFRHNFERIESDSSEAIKLNHRRYARKKMSVPIPVNWKFQKVPALMHLVPICNKVALFVLFLLIYFVFGLFFVLLGCVKKIWGKHTTFRFCFVSPVFVLLMFSIFFLLFNVEKICINNINK